MHVSRVHVAIALAAVFSTALPIGPLLAQTDSLDRTATATPLDLAGPGLGPGTSWVTHDLQLAWRAPWNCDVVIGIDNLTDREPTRLCNDFDRYDTNLYDNYGRLGYFRYVQRF